MNLPEQAGQARRRKRLNLQQLEELSSKVIIPTDPIGNFYARQGDYMPSVYLDEDGIPRLTDEEKLNEAGRLDPPMGIAPPTPPVLGEESDPEARLRGSNERFTWGQIKSWFDEGESPRGQGMSSNFGDLPTDRGKKKRRVRVEQPKKSLNEKGEIILEKNGQDINVNEILRPPNTAIRTEQPKGILDQDRSGIYRQIQTESAPQDVLNSTDILQRDARDQQTAQALEERRQIQREQEQKPVLEQLYEPIQDASKDFYKGMEQIFTLENPPAGVVNLGNFLMKGLGVPFTAADVLTRQTGLKPIAEGVGGVFETLMNIPTDISNTSGQIMREVGAEPYAEAFGNFLGISPEKANDFSTALQEFNSLAVPLLLGGLKGGKKLAPSDFLKKGTEMTTRNIGEIPINQKAPIESPVIPKVEKLADIKEPVKVNADPRGQIELKAFEQKFDQAIKNKTPIEQVPEALVNSQSPSIRSRADYLKGAVDDFNSSLKETPKTEQVKGIEITERTTIDKLVEQTGKPVNEILPEITRLELEGKIKRNPDRSIEPITETPKVETVKEQPKVEAPKPEPVKTETNVPNNIPVKQAPITNWVKNQRGLTIEEKPLRPGVTAKYQWDAQNKRGRIIVTPEAKVGDIYHELGHHIRRQKGDNILLRNKEELNLFKGESLSERLSEAVEQFYTNPESRNIAPKLWEQVKEFGLPEMTAEVKPRKRFVKEETYQAALKSFKDRGKQFNTGIDPTSLKDLSIIGAYHLENLAIKGADNYRTWNTEMKKTLQGMVGDRALRQVFDEINKKGVERFREVSTKRTADVIEKRRENLSKINTEKDLNDFIKNIVETDEYGKTVKKEAFGRQTEKMTSDLAEMLDIKEKDVVNIKKGEVYNAAELRAMRQVVEDNTLTLYEKALSLDNSPTAINDFRQALTLNMTMRAKVRGVKGEIARTLQSLNQQITPNEFKMLEAVREQIRKEYGENAKELVTLDELTKFGSKVSEMVKPTWKEKAMYVWYNSMLSNPYTQLANITGNLTSLLFETTQKSINPREWVSVYDGFSKGVPEGLRNIKKVFKQDAETLSKWSIEDKKNLEPFGFNFRGGKVARGMMPTTWLSAMDGFFRPIFENMQRTTARKQIARDMFPMKDTFGNAMRDNFGRLDKGTGLKVDAWIKEILEDPAMLDPESTRFKSYVESNKKLENAIREVQSISRQGDYGLLQTPLGYAGSKFQSWLNVSPAKLLIPFLRIGVNIGKTGLRSSPYGFVDLMRKNLSKTEKMQAVRRAAVGSIIYWYLINKIGEGGVEVTGSLSSNYNKQMLQEESGYKPYHLYFIGKDGEKTGYSYQNITPVNFLLGAFGEYMDRRRDNSLKDEESSNLLMAGLMGFGTFIADQPYMKSIKDFLSVFDKRNPDEKPVNYGYRFLTNFTPSFVNFIREIRGENETLYEAHTLDEHFKRKLGKGLAEALGMDWDLKEQLNQFGNPRKNTYERFPYFPSGKEVNKVAKFLLDNNIIIGKPSKNTMLKGIEMTDDQYYKYNKKQGQLILQTLNKYTDTLESYSPEEKEQVVESIVSGIRKGVKEEMEDPKVKFDVSGVEKVLKYKKKHIEVNNILSKSGATSSNGNPYKYKMEEYETEGGQIDINRVVRLLIENRTVDNFDQNNKAIEEIKNLK